MTRITYSRETLLRYNTPACQIAPVVIPKELRITQYPNIATLFNNRHGSACRPYVGERFNHDLDPSCGAAVVCIN